MRQPTLVTLRCLMAYLLLFGVPAFAAPEADGPHAQLSLLTETLTAEPGKPLVAGIEFKIQAGWHVYWVNAGDSGQAPRLLWKLPEGFSAGAIQWPVPHRLPEGPLMNFGYEKEVLLPVELSVGSSLTGSQTIAVKVKYLICKDVCTPGTVDLDRAIAVENHPASASNDAPKFAHARSELPLPLPSDWSVSAEEKDKALVLHFSHLPSATDFFFYPEQPELIDDAAKQVFDHGTLELKKSDQFSVVPQKFTGVLTFKSHGSEKAYAIAPIFPNAPQPKPQAPVAAKSTSTDFWLALAFALFGGVILNLMPCVFPVLSLKALGLLQLAEKGESDSTMHARAHGWAYTFGILTAFWSFGALILIFRSGGSALGWGFQLQSPVFVAILCDLLFVVSLNLLGVFEVSFAFAGAGGKLAQLPGLGGSFFTGVLATLVATPCTAPFMGTALGYAVAQPAPLAMAIFTALGAGLAAPYLLLSFWPRLARSLPRPGRWMETFKQFLAFPILGTVIWLFWVHSLQTDSWGSSVLLSSFLLISVGAWAVGRWQTPWAWATLGAATCGAVALAASVQASSMSPSANADGPWQRFSRDAVKSAIAAKRPVFVDFTAAWCVTCKVNEKLALAPQGPVMQKMKDLGVVLLRGDWTNADPEITSVLAEFGRNGVPLYLLYSGKENDAPRVLPQILTEAEVLKEVTNLK